MIGEILMWSVCVVGGDCWVPNPFDTLIGVALQKERKLQGSSSAGSV